MHVRVAVGEEEVLTQLSVFGLNSANCNIVTKFVKKLVRADLLTIDEAE